MMRPVIVRTMYGMYGPATDPGERAFTELLRREMPGIDLGRSPYRDYDVQEIADDFSRSHPTAVRICVGSSLGANNCPVVAARTKVAVHGIFGFQASSYGADMPITQNVLFAHLFRNPIWLMTFGLGTATWRRNIGNSRTSLIVSSEYAMHPGETQKAMSTFLAEIKRIAARPGDET
jgi:hypothetical protein